jgi:choline dehydrogenase
MVGGLLFLRRLFAAPALAQYVICETTPGPGVATDDEPLNFARQNGSLDRKPTAQTDPKRT